MSVIGFKVDGDMIQYNFPNLDNKPDIDATPTANSTNAVQSGGVKSALDALQAQIPQIDSTLSQSGQAADAKAVGTWVEALRTSVYTGEDIYKTPIAVNKTHNGITYTWDGQTCTASGTASNTSFCNFIGSLSVMPSALHAGGYYLVTVNSTDPNLLLRVSTGTSSEYITPDFYNGTGLLHIPDDATYCIMRYQVYNGYTVNGTITAEIHELLPIPNGFISTYLAPSTGDRTSDIENILSTYGICRLGKGDYTVGNITMPDGSVIVGEGDSTKIYFDSSVTGSAITMGSRCTVRDITLYGADSDLTLDGTIAERHGIQWTGETVENGIVSGCRVERFSGSGIYMHDTTTDIDQHLAVSDCLVRNCTVGVFIKANSEFHKISSCTIVKNYYGILNRGGNNNISNCGIDGNVIGIQIDADEGTNGGHGAITGCSINHSGSNTGYGIIIKDTGREIISNCNLYFSKVKLQSTDGNVITNCGFGNNAVIEVAAGSNTKCNIIANCMFRTSSGAIVNTSGNTKVLNCWNREGTAITI